MAFTHGFNKQASDLGNMINTNIGKAMGTQAGTPPPPKPPAPPQPQSMMGRAFGAIKGAFGS